MNWIVYTNDYWNVFQILLSWDGSAMVLNIYGLLHEVLLIINNTTRCLIWEIESSLIYISKIYFSFSCYSYNRSFNISKYTYKFINK